MRWMRFEYEGRVVHGRVSANNQQVELTDLNWADILAGRTATHTLAHIPLAAVQPLSPVPQPGKIVCIGLNYLDHCRETGIEPPTKPLIFTKFTSALTDPGADIIWSPEVTNQVDFEGELAVVIGREARRVAAKEALDYVAGYTIGNDVSARDVQFGDGQWVRGKSLDTFCPLGPVLVTAVAIPDPQTLAIRTLLNGQVMQDSSTAEMIFSVAELIAYCSQSFTLYPGDVLLTGTPHGVGLGREPRVWMQDGDEIVVEIEQIGRLANQCRVVG